MYGTLPEILNVFSVDVADVLDAAGLPADTLDDPDNRIAYTAIGRLLSASVRLTNCDHIGLLIGQRAHLAAMGLVGQIALSAGTAGEALRNLANSFAVHNTAATVSLIRSGDFTRLVFAITEPGMGDTGQIQLGAMALACNILRDLCGPGWLPTAITVASSAPSNLRPCQTFFRAPLRFDSAESALIFESRWLEQPLPPLDPLEQQQVEAALQAHRAAILADFTRTVRRVVRKQLTLGECSMESVAATLGVHRRTLARQLQRHGTRYNQILDSVQRDVACQLLRDTAMPVQRIAESLHYSSAANFSTAFRRWTGVTPGTYRRQAR